MDYTTATMDDLQAEFVRLANVVSFAEDQRNQIDREMQSRQRTALAKARLGSMTEQEVEAMKSVLQVSDAATLAMPVSGVKA